MRPFEGVRSTSAYWQEQGLGTGRIHPRQEALLPPPLRRRFRDPVTGEESSDLLSLRSGRSLDLLGLADLLAYGGQIGSRTPLVGVERVQERWELPEPSVHPGDLVDADARADRLWLLLQEAVARALVSGTKPLIPLSGGLDSRAVAAAAAAVAPGVCVAMSFGDPDCPDLPVARWISHRLRLPHRVFLFDRSDAARQELRVWQASGGTGGPESSPGAPTDESWARVGDLLLSGTSGDVIWGDTVLPGPAPARRMQRLGFPLSPAPTDEDLPPTPP